MSPESASTSNEDSGQRPKVLYFGGSHDSEINLPNCLGEGVEIVEVHSTPDVLSHLVRGEFSAVYCDAENFANSLDISKLFCGDRILEGMPDGVVLLDREYNILWGNGRLKEWSGSEKVLGENFYRVMGSPELLGPDFCPLQSALATRRACASIMRRDDNKYFRLHAAPVFIPGSDEPPQNLVVSVHDMSEEVLQQQKLAAIHHAGVELADLTTNDVAQLLEEERIELLKSNILQCLQEILQLDVVEIRMLDQDTGELIPLLEVGMLAEAAARKLYASTSGNGVTGFVAATGKSYICEHTLEDPLYLEGVEGARSSLTVPLILHDQVIGTLNVESPEGSAFTESDLQFLEIFARSVAVALNTLELLAAEKASTAAASVEAIHSAVALPVDVILNDAVNIMERYIGHEPDVVERLHRILRNARDIKQVIQKVGQSLSPTQAQPASGLTESRPKLVGRRILVVDDDASVRSAAHALLERYQCVVETAHDGYEACLMVRNLVEGAAYDVIIADIRLPDMSGYELMIKLADMMQQVPMVLMTGFGYDPGHSIVKARQAGLQHVLYKPFRLDQLVSIVESTIDATSSTA
ncbi:Transcriptional regulatory protein ZraR [Bythopirellula polymerisocia]|uniref:Transcriptional regulatory protein ZraR n=1 Tax=Bythopirellula polymerisocia TaxID=2528003 RepID=A0A5C6CRL4_9BACT|nr:Transcriptional regulatory protein ZraR [Bythopirellula polymerisocia]